MGIFGDVIFDRMAERKWSYARMAKESGLSIGTLQSVKKMDAPGVHGDTLEKLGKPFGMSAQDVLAEYKDRKANYDAVGGDPRTSLDLPLSLIKRIEETAAAQGRSVADLLAALLTLAPVAPAAPVRGLPAQDVTDAETTEKAESPANGPPRQAGAGQAGAAAAKPPRAPRKRTHTPTPARREG